MKLIIFYCNVPPGHIENITLFVFILIVAWACNWIFWGRHDAEILGQLIGTIPYSPKIVELFGI